MVKVLEVVSFAFAGDVCVWEKTGKPTLIPQLTGMRLNFYLVSRGKHMILHSGFICVAKVLAQNWIFFI